MVTFDELPDLERERIAAAITEAERRTSGELVVVVARICDPYLHVAFLWPSIVALVLPLPWLMLAPAAPAATIYAAQLAVMALGLAAMLVAPIRLALVPRAVKELRARRLAREQFLEEGVDHTAGRTGVLLFVALGEHYAEIIADSGIDARVEPGAWDACLARLLGAARSGKLADGLIAAIDEIGQMLARHAPAPAGNRNEIADRLVIL
jgi:putative membrane protein